MELAGGIHRVDGVRGANCYLVPGPEGLYLVDTGMPGSAPAILGYLRKLGRRETDLRLILLTHPDIDHAGSVAELKKRTGAGVAIHAGDAGALTGEHPPRRIKGLLGVLVQLLSKLMRVPHVTPDLLLEDGQRIGPLTVIAVPGHTEGSVCFLAEASRTILVGDALRVTRGGEVVVSPSFMNADEDRAWASARRIAALSFDSLLPGHGEPLLQGADHHVRQLALADRRSAGAGG